MTTPRVLLADDHPVYRDGLRMMLASTGQAEVVGTAADGEEAVAMAGFLRSDIKLHEEFADDWAEPARQAADAFEAFAAKLDGLADADPACGEAYLTQLMSGVHGLSLSPREAVAQAHAAYDRMGDELVEMARAIDPAKTWQDIVAGLSDEHPADAEAVHDDALAGQTGDEGGFEHRRRDAGVAADHRLRPAEHAGGGAPEVEREGRREIDVGDAANAVGAELHAGLGALSAW